MAPIQLKVKSPITDRFPCEPESLLCPFPSKILVSFAKLSRRRCSSAWNNGANSFVSKHLPTILGSKSILASSRSVLSDAWETKEAGVKSSDRYRNSSSGPFLGGSREEMTIDFPLDAGPSNMRTRQWVRSCIDKAPIVASAARHASHRCGS